MVAPSACHRGGSSMTQFNQCYRLRYECSGCPRSPNWSSLDQSGPSFHGPSSTSCANRMRKAIEASQTSTPSPNRHAPTMTLAMAHRRAPADSRWAVSSSPAPNARAARCDASSAGIPVGQKISIPAMTQPTGALVNPARTGAGGRVAGAGCGGGGTGPGSAAFVSDATVSSKGSVRAYGPDPSCAALRDAGVRSAHGFSAGGVAGLLRLLGSRVRRPEWSFMNYGYAPVSTRSPSPARPRRRARPLLHPAVLAHALDQRRRRGGRRPRDRLRSRWRCLVDQPDLGPRSTTGVDFAASAGHALPTRPAWTGPELRAR